MSTTSIEQYKILKCEHIEAVKWLSLIGSPYHGGGGGIGNLRTLKLDKGDGAPTVYHQQYDGANNYHIMPSSLAPYLEAEIKARFNELIKGALARQEVELKTASEQALKEHEELLIDAGLF